jgi:hypothetical protein
MKRNKEEPLGRSFYYVLSYYGREGKPSTKLVGSFVNHSMARIEKKPRPRANQRFFLIILDLNGSTSDPVGQPRKLGESDLLIVPDSGRPPESSMADSADAGKTRDKKRKPRRELHRI